MQKADTGASGNWAPFLQFAPGQPRLRAGGQGPETVGLAGQAWLMAAPPPLDSAPGASCQICHFSTTKYLPPARPGRWEGPVGLGVQRGCPGRSCSRYYGNTQWCSSHRLPRRCSKSFTSQKWVNRELPDAQPGSRKGGGTRDQTASVRRIIEKAREFQKNIYFYFMGYAKAFNCADHNTLENS